MHKIIKIKQHLKLYIALKDKRRQPCGSNNEKNTLRLINNTFIFTNSKNNSNDP